MRWSARLGLQCEQELEPRRICEKCKQRSEIAEPTRRRKGGTRTMRCGMVCHTPPAGLGAMRRFDVTRTHLRAPPGSDNV